MLQIQSCLREEISRGKSKLRNVQRASAKNEKRKLQLEEQLQRLQAEEVEIRTQEQELLEQLQTHEQTCVQPARLGELQDQLQQLQDEENSSSTSTTSVEQKELAINN
jgi:hypothetical protein